MMMEVLMKRKALIAAGLVLAIGLAAAAGVAAAEGELEIAGRGVRHGLVTSVDDQGFTLRTRRGEMTLLVDKNTRFRIRGVQEAGLDDLGVGDHVGVAGLRTAEGTLIARLVVVIPPRADVGQLWGEVTAIGDRRLEVARRDGVAVTLLVSEDTRFRVPDVTDPGLEELEVGDSVFARGLWNQEGQLDARLIGLLPEGVERAVRGRVTAVDAPQIEVLARQGPIVITADGNTRYHVPGVENPSLSDISVDDTILAGGARLDGENLAAVIAVIPPGTQRARRLGTVTAVAEDSLTMETRRGEVITVVADENTRFRIPGAEHPTLDDIEVGFQAAAAGWMNPDNGTLRARFIGARPTPTQEQPE
jgi:hypothetical protein